MDYISRPIILSIRKNNGSKKVSMFRLNWNYWYIKYEITELLLLWFSLSIFQKLTIVQRLILIQKPHNDSSTYVSFYDLLLNNKTILWLQIISICIPKKCKKSFFFVFKSPKLHNNTVLWFIRCEPLFCAWLLLPSFNYKYYQNLSLRQIFIH